ncbi:ABC transporter ATP-binding protein [Pseudoalteromonas byunsanensis]|uniref:ABC transporter ATP-binding protein n=1 Tax=Pseudoalteromonas byunsanensis TaxID=327939 RepID=A0A1S1N7P9_9GAMM|nr:ABC transporter ATP-binding protein [Pseudoalteromonas byunsanensis]OHU95390.1 ABC transporter ATP-binding protein [Pseudoalteromonas byunsanensis]
MTKAVIELNNIYKSFRTDDVETHALTDISLTINEGEFVSFTGPSGSGKSTLLSILGLLDEVSSGTFKICGIDVTHLDRDQRAGVRNQEIGFIFQSFNLISDLTVEENVMLPLSYQKEVSHAQAKRMATEVLKKVNMEHRLNHFPSQLSGGQQQRVAIARALVNKPSLILADEPTGNLDSTNATAVMEILHQLHQEGSTICMVTHDPRSLDNVSRNVEILDGQIRLPTDVPCDKDADKKHSEGAEVCM